jgi:flagellar motor component MotA
MTELFYMGGPLFMGILTILLMIIVTVFAFRLYQLLQNQVKRETTFRHQAQIIKSLGLFTFMIGILGQLIGLFQAFSAIQQLNSISPAMLAGGLKVSMITTLYGLIIFLVSYLLYWVLEYVINQKLSHE